MEEVERGVRGWGGNDWGTKCLPRDPALLMTPIGPVQQDQPGEVGIGMSTISLLSGKKGTGHPG